MYLESDERLASVRPSSRQLAQQEMEFYGFFHFGMNTFTDREWGDGTEPEAWFCPSAIVDTDQWVESAAQAGMKGVILTCKHHDGFCLWPSAYSSHTVATSPYLNGKGDIVRQVSESCKKFGLKFGVYLSPWDRNHSSYGSGRAYDEYYVNQLTELLTKYGDIFCVWMDGACGEGCNGKIQEYNWSYYFEVVRRLQPGACISICGPDVRWCGNEAGDTRESEWSVVPARVASASETAKRSQQEESVSFRQQKLSEQEQDLGSRERLLEEDDLIWYPAEVDMSIRPGWFYHKEEDEQVCSFSKLRDIYLKSVGGNAMLLLNVPPNKDGKIAEPDVKLLQKFGQFLSEEFADDLVEQAEIKGDESEIGYPPEHLKCGKKDLYFKTKECVTTATISLQWKEVKTIRYVVLQEYLQMGQRVERFSIYEGKKREKPLAEGTVIGHKKIVCLPKHTRVDHLSIEIHDARAGIALQSVAVY